MQYFPSFVVKKPCIPQADVSGTIVAIGNQVKDWKISHFHYFLMAEADYVTAVGTWRVNGAMQWDWVQTFRIANGKIVETWLPAMSTDGKWVKADIPG